MRVADCGFQNAKSSTEIRISISQFAIQNYLPAAGVRCLLICGPS